MFFRFNDNEKHVHYIRLEAIESVNFFPKGTSTTAQDDDTLTFRSMGSNLIFQPIKGKDARRIRDEFDNFISRGGIA